MAETKKRKGGKGVTSYVPHIAIFPLPDGLDEAFELVKELVQGGVKRVHITILSEGEI